MNGNTNVVRHKPAERRAKMLALLDEIEDMLADRMTHVPQVDELRQMIDPRK